MNCLIYGSEIISQINVLYLETAVQYFMTLDVRIFKAWNKASSQDPFTPLPHNNILIIKFVCKLNQLLPLIINNFPVDVFLRRPPKLD